jgi:hypothetical protein
MCPSVLTKRAGPARWVSVIEQDFAPVFCGGWDVWVWINGILVFCKDVIRKEQP